ncbi:MAG: NYN domain-containing protein [Candidatus Caldarchaeum sp.]|nr:NYN domain-containing protein [Candidatus Caldarchaeum sp.]MCS7138413.1 NYN domain-containing protein [Candidatus Caldarchaeum sp.]MDW7978834.1 NYN domain-containing protein [Candidatus Caldarchaeum sp.]MDW8359502.1 NYN domain-containing protein [Candidatus Caldarchaeum sp.]
MYPAEKAAVFIDGGYLEKLLKHYFAEKRIDPAANREVMVEPRIDFLRLSELLCKGYERFRTYYYNCMPYQSNPPTREESERYSNKRRFIQYLQRLPRFQVRLGRLRKTASGEFEQKGVDVQLAIDLVELAAVRTIRKAVLIGGDADYVPPVKKARDFHVIVELYYHSRHVSDELFDACDERTEITEELVDSVRIINP